MAKRPGDHQGPKVISRSASIIYVFCRKRGNSGWPSEEYHWRQTDISVLRQKRSQGKGCGQRGRVPQGILRSRKERGCPTGQKEFLRPFLRFNDHRYYTTRERALEKVRADCHDQIRHRGWITAGHLEGSSGNQQTPGQAFSPERPETDSTGNA